MFIINWLVNLYKDFINIYDDSEFREHSAGFFSDNQSFSDDYVRNAVKSGDPDTGKRKISVKKILFRIVIVVLIVFFVFILFRVNTNVSFWGNR